jgi:hypothetical protein
MTEQIRRWRGLTQLIGAAVEHGASAVERVHMATAQRPFTILEHIPVIAAPAFIVDKIYGATTAAVYESVRVITRLAAKTLDLALEAIDEEAPEEPQLSDELE